MPPEFSVSPPAALPGFQPAAALGRGGEAEPAAGGGQSEERTAEGDKQNGEAKHTDTHTHTPQQKKDGYLHPDMSMV